MSITLFEFPPTRSARVRWTLLELGISFESVSGREVIGSPRLAEISPSGKVPAILDDGRPLFEFGGHLHLARRQPPRKRADRIVRDLGAGAARSVGLLLPRRARGPSLEHLSQPLSLSRGAKGSGRLRAERKGRAPLARGAGPTPRIDAVPRRGQVHGGGHHRRLHDELGPSGRLGHRARALPGLQCAAPGHGELPLSEGLKRCRVRRPSGR